MISQSELIRRLRHERALFERESQTDYTKGYKQGLYVAELHVRELGHLDPMVKLLKLAKTNRWKAVEFYKTIKRVLYLLMEGERTKAVKRLQETIVKGM